MTLNETPNEPKSFPPTQTNAGDRKTLKQIYISLMVIGLVIGGVLSVGIYLAMDHFGLTARPGQLEQSEG